MVAHNVTYCLNQIIYGTVLITDRKTLCVKLHWSLINCSLPQIPEIFIQYQKSIVVVKCMEIKFSMFLNLFDVTSIFFRFLVFDVGFLCLVFSEFLFF